MSRSMLLLLVAVVSLGLPAWQIVLAFRRGVDLRRAPRAIFSRGVFRIVRTGWYALLMICVGVLILPLGINGYQEFVSYSASPRCVAAPSYDCRQLRPAVVAGVANQTTRSGPETTVDFAGAVGSATFYADAVGPSAVAKGTTVTVEVWHGKVTAIVLDDVDHHSFATQSDAWILIPLAIGMFLLGVVSLALTAATTESSTKMAKSELFVAPTGRRYTLYVLVGLFAGLSAILAAGGIFEAAGMKPVSGTLYGIAFFGLLLDLAVIPVFIAWFWRAYRNLDALGRKPMHSWTFVLAALVVPPLNLFLPYQLMGELVSKSRAPIARSWIGAWWAAGVAWLVIFIAGGSTGSAGTPNAQILSDVGIVVCLVPALVVSFLTVVIVREVDHAQRMLASDSALPVQAPATHEPAPQPSPAPRTSPAPEIPLHQLDEARLSSSSDRVGIRPSFRRWLRQMRLAIPTFVILVAIGMLRGLADNSQWLLWVLPALLVAIAAGWYLWFRNVSLFSGAGYFGRTNLLGQRVVFRSATLRRVLLRMVATNYSATPRLILIDDSNRILFQVNPNGWEPGDLQRFLDSLNAKPEEDLNPVGYWSLKRQIRDGQT